MSHDGVLIPTPIKEQSMDIGLRTEVERSNSEDEQLAMCMWRQVEV